MSKQALTDVNDWVSKPHREDTIRAEEMRESFEQSVTDPENQPSQYGTVPMKEWVNLTDEEIEDMANDFEEGYVFLYRSFAAAIEAKLKEKNT